MNILNILSEETFVEKFDGVIEALRSKDDVEHPEGGISKIQKYTIDADEYRNKTGEQFFVYQPRQVSEGVFDVTVKLRVRIWKELYSDKPYPVFVNPPIDYEISEDSVFIFPLADLKDIKVFVRDDVFEGFVSGKLINDFVSAPSSSCEFNDEGYAEISATAYGFDNDTAVAIRNDIDFYNDITKSVTLYYVSYETGEEETGVIE